MTDQVEALDWRWFVRPGDVVFDVGANVGNKTDSFLQYGAQVVCIEPQPDCVKALKRRFKRNRRVTILPKGLAEKAGALELSICSQANTISTFSDEWKTGRFAEYQWDKVIRVPVTTLDEVIREHGAPAYCKIDVEGFEISVLQGLTRPVPLLSFEFAREFMGRAKACVSYLQQIGFERFNFIEGENPQFTCGGWLDARALFERIGQIDNPKLWGDIYAQHGAQSAGKPPQPIGVAVPAGKPAGIGAAIRQLFG